MSYPCRNICNTLYSRVYESFICPAYCKYLNLAAKVWAPFTVNRKVRSLMQYFKEKITLSLSAHFNIKSNHHLNPLLCSPYFFKILLNRDSPPPQKTSNTKKCSDLGNQTSQQFVKLKLAL